MRQKIKHKNYKLRKDYDIKKLKTKKYMKQ